MAFFRVVFPALKKICIRRRFNVLDGHKTTFVQEWLKDFKDHKSGNLLSHSYSKIVIKIYHCTKFSFNIFQKVMQNMKYISDKLIF